MDQWTQEWYPVRCGNCGAKFYAHLEEHVWVFYAYFDTWLPLEPINLDEIEVCPTCSLELDFEDTIPDHEDNEDE